MRVYAKSGDKYYKLTVSHSWCAKNNNYAMVSCGLEVGVDLKQSQLGALLRQGKAVEVSKDEWLHSGCLSSCIRRGDKECR